jgi:hypothetical protein
MVLLRGAQQINPVGCVVIGHVSKVSQIFLTNKKSFCYYFAFALCNDEV